MIKIVNLIIPIYNSRETLPKALDSLVAQTKQMFLVTLVQDCDESNYDDIIKEYTRRGLHINLLKTEVNSGPGMARQLGIDKSRMCDYIMFLDSDDILMPRAIEVLYREAKHGGADVVTSSIIREQEGSPGFIMDAAVTPVTWTHGKIYRTEYLRERNIRFREDLRLNEDSYFNLVACNSTEKFVKIPEITYLWRDYKGSLTRVVSHKEFFEKSWVQYIKSQVKGIQEIIAQTGDITPGLLAATLINMYNHDMEASFYGLDTEEDRELENEFRSVPQIKKAMSTKEFWDYIHLNLRASLMIEDALIFYKMRFTDWLGDRIE